MGTSSSNSGPKGKTPLLPSWYGGNAGSGSPGNGNQGGSPNGDSDSSGGNTPTDGNSLQVNIAADSGSQTAEWKHGKASLTRYSKGTRGGSAGRAASGYVKSLGGSRKATTSARLGISAGKRLVGFLSSVGRNGLNVSLREVGLDNFIGRSTEEILAKIADAIAPIGSTSDEAIARDAILATLDKLFEKVETEGGDISSLENLTTADIKDVVITYVSTYIFEKWLYELGLAIEKNSISESRAIQLEQEMYDYVEAEVKSTMDNTFMAALDLDNLSNNSQLEEIFQTAYSTLEE